MQVNNENNFVIGTNGNVGIGTSSPTYHFHAVGSDRARFEQTQGIIDIVAYGSGTHAFNSTAGLFASNQNALIMTGLQGSGDIKLVTRPSGYSTRMIIKSDGRVGIGTNGPESILHTSQLNAGSKSIGLILQNPSTSTNTETSILFVNRNNYVLTSPYRRGELAMKADGSGNQDFFVRLAGGGGLTDRLFIDGNNGNVGIGTTNPDPNHKLSVNGSIRSKEVKVEANWSDFVFYDNYNLRTLEEVEQYIHEKGHLPEIPSETEVSENGINLGEMNAKLLQKIEELTLYMIDMNKQVQQLKSENQELKEEISTLKNE